MSAVTAPATEIEPRVAEVLDAKMARRGRGPYRSLTDDEVRTRLDALLSSAGVAGHAIEDLGRMAGGASKEQFSFTLRSQDGATERLVLRVDPGESVVETCRHREAEVMALVAADVPVPETRFLDGEGEHLGQPGVVSTFVPGVAKPPTDAGQVVSGLGTQFSRAWRDRIAPQFVDTIARIHAADWRSADLPHLQAPTGDPRQAARWQVNWWSRVRAEDVVDPVPLLTLTERWLRERLPATEDLVLLHGDFRTGNFLFDGETGAFTAVLDWELTHIGDHHEDLAWLLLPMFGGADEEGRPLASNLMSREAFVAAYESASGRSVDDRTLAFYEVLSVYKLAIMILGTGSHSATTAASHQDVMMSWLAALGHSVLAQLALLIDAEETA